MKYLIVLITTLMLTLTSVWSQSDNPKELAHAKAREAFRLEDEEGKFAEALVLLQEAEKLDPENFDYPYEIAYNYMGSKDYKNAIKLLEKLIRRPDTNPQAYQLLGNAYDYTGKPEKAIKTYETGLKKFPDAGELFLELGTMQQMKEEYNKALNLYEDGVLHDPEFPSNYYWCTRLYLSSDEKVWGMLYGELFMNLERAGKRNTDIGKRLYDTYKSQITHTSDTSIQVSFSKNNVIALSIESLQKDLDNLKFPFPIICYEPLMAMSVAGTGEINLASLHQIRTRFLNAYQQKDMREKYPNILFDYQEKIRQAGHFEAYNYWLLGEGNVTERDEWIVNHRSAWDAFIAWFTENGLQLSSGYKFHRTQYN